MMDLTLQTSIIYSYKYAKQIYQWILDDEIIDKEGNEVNDNSSNNNPIKEIMENYELGRKTNSYTSAAISHLMKVIWTFAEAKYGKLLKGFWPYGNLISTQPDDDERLKYH